MKTSTGLIIAGASFAAWWLFLRKPPGYGEPVVTGIASQTAKRLRDAFKSRIGVGDDPSAGVTSSPDKTASDISGENTPTGANTSTGLYRTTL